MKKGKLLSVTGVGTFSTYKEKDYFEIVMDRFNLLGKKEDENEEPNPYE